jgi:hypothetical protein
MGAFQKIVEWGTDAQYVPRSQKCDICGGKLGFLETGFWSINAKRLTDGVLCKHCYEKLEMLAEYRTYWVPKSLRKEKPFCDLLVKKLFQLDQQSVRYLLDAAENLAKDELTVNGGEYTAIFRMKDACFIEPAALQVGVVRAKQLKHRLVLFGFVQLGQFQKGDRVLILDGAYRRETRVLEAYVYDCEENTLEVMLKAHMGKQCLTQWQVGWLVLDDTEKVADNTTVVGGK